MRGLLRLVIGLAVDGNEEVQQTDAERDDRHCEEHKGDGRAQLLAADCI